MNLIFAFILVGTIAWHRGAHAAEPIITCGLERAVYHATLKAGNSPPDELRLRFKDAEWSGHGLGLPRAVIRSVERNFQIALDPYFTNGSAVVGVTGSIPFNKLPNHMQQFNREAHEHALKSPEDYAATHGEEYNGQWLQPLELGSIAVSVYPDFEVAHLPTAETPAPMLIMFPEFRHKAHLSTFEAVGHGLAWGVFKFHHCE